MVKSNLYIDVWQGGSLECQNQAVVVFPWLIESAYAHGFFDDSQSRKLQPMWIERKLGVDIDPSAYPECWK